jgi:autophagy-related protein 27
MAGPVCGIETVQHKDDKPVVHKVLPIAGNIGDRKLDAEVTRKTPSKSKEDPVVEGFQVTLHGGEYNKVKQAVTIDFICDKDRTGLETEDGKAKREEKKEPSKASLQFKSYEEGTEISTLKLTWLTKAACESKNAPGGGDGSDHSASWGFFTWFIIMFVYLYTAIDNR